MTTKEEMDILFELMDDGKKKINYKNLKRKLIIYNVLNNTKYTLKDLGLFYIDPEEVLLKRFFTEDDYGHMYYCCEKINNYRALDIDYHLLGQIRDNYNSAYDMLVKELEKCDFVVDTLRYHLRKDDMCYIQINRDIMSKVEINLTLYEYARHEFNYNYTELCIIVSNVYKEYVIPRLIDELHANGVEIEFQDYEDIKN